MENLNPNFKELAEKNPAQKEKPLPDNVKQSYPQRMQGGGFVNAWRW